MRRSTVTQAIALSRTVGVEVPRAYPRCEAAIAIAHWGCRNNDMTALMCDTVFLGRRRPGEGAGGLAARRATGIRLWVGGRSAPKPPSAQLTSYAYPSVAA